ncbi:MAG: glycosyltransferase [Fretibacterium sp.]|nr:glycosyltransferase [Fretibacterium sp.]
MKRALLVASVASMIDQFNIPNIRLLQDMGLEVDVACNFEKGSTCPQEKVSQLLMLLEELKVNCYQVDFDRHTQNLMGHVKACRQMKSVLLGERAPLGKNHHSGGGYAFVHCHSPIGGVIGRLMAWQLGEIKTLYTAHGFHFYTGAPLGNWLAFYPIEKALAHITDTLITINGEDYQRACRSLRAKRVYYVPGIGIDLKKYHRGQIDVRAKREELGVREDEILILSVGELIPRKDHETVVRALARTGRQGFQYLICGTGPLHEMLSALVRQEGLDGQVKLPGFRTDIAELCQAADLFVFPSRQEGLSVAMMEAIACETPVMCSAIRGNTDLVQDEKYLFRSGDVKGLARMLQECLSGGRDALHQAMSRVAAENYERLRKFDLMAVGSQMRKIYGELLQ